MAFDRALGPALSLAVQMAELRRFRHLALVLVGGGSTMSIAHDLRTRTQPAATEQTGRAESVSSRGSRDPGASTSASPSARPSSTAPATPSPGNYPLDAAEAQVPSRLMPSLAGGGLSPDAKGQDVVVQSRPPRGSVAGAPPPERKYSALDIRTYGADNLDALLQDIVPQTESNVQGGTGRPLILLNGRRVAGFSEIAKIPTEAIERVEVLTEDVALNFGFRPDQKVVNVVTFETFSSKVVQVSSGLARGGEYTSLGVEGTSFLIRRGVQLSLNVEGHNSSYLLDQDRETANGIAAGCSQCARSLYPAAAGASVGATLRMPILEGISGSINATFSSEGNRALLGSSEVGQLKRKADADTIHLGGTLNGVAGKWLWSAIGSYDRNTSATATTPALDVAAPFDGRSSAATGFLEGLASGPITSVPAGHIVGTVRFRAGRDTYGGGSRTGLSGEDQERSRNERSIQASFDVPITSRRRGHGIGRLAVNGNFAVDHVSEFKTLSTIGYGLFWSPTSTVNIRASVSSEERAPAIQQLTAPRLAIPNTQLHDFDQGRVVDVLQIVGGNAGLQSERRDTLSVEAFYNPIDGHDLSLILNYSEAVVSNPISVFPIASADVQSAFPERYLRGAGRQLLQVDTRPLNFRRSDQSRVRTGVSFSKPLSEGPPAPRNVIRSDTQFYPNDAAARAATPPGVAVVEVPYGSGEAQRLDAASSRVTVSLFYTYNIRDELTLKVGGPVLNLLKGSSTAFLGGTPRHEIKFVSGLYKGGLGARMSLNWRSGSTVNGDPNADQELAGRLRFSSFASTDLSMFILPAQRFENVRALDWTSGIRVTFDVSNLFDKAPRVRLASGNTPLVYSPAYLNPLGRVVRLTVRKMF